MDKLVTIFYTAVYLITEYGRKALGMDMGKYLIDD